MPKAGRFDKEYIHKTRYPSMCSMMCMVFMQGTVVSYHGSSMLGRINILDHVANFSDTGETASSQIIKFDPIVFLTLLTSSPNEVR